MGAGWPLPDARGFLRLLHDSVPDGCYELSVAIINHPLYESEIRDEFLSGFVSRLVVLSDMLQLFFPKPSGLRISRRKSHSCIPGGDGGG